MYLKYKCKIQSGWLDVKVETKYQKFESIN